MTRKEPQLGELGTHTVVVDEFRGTATWFPENTQQQVIDDVTQMKAAGEAVPVKLTGVQVEGKTHWTMEYHYILADDVVINTSDPKNLVGHHSEVSRQILAWLSTYSDGFLEARQQGLVARREFGLIQANGRIFQVYSWSKEYAEFGQVTYFEGFATK